MIPDIEEMEGGVAEGEGGVVEEGVVVRETGMTKGEKSKIIKATDQVEGWSLFSTGG